MGGAKSVLPSGYVAVDYVPINGDMYFKTDVIPNQGTIISITFNKIAGGTQYPGIFSAHYNNRNSGEFSAFMAIGSLSKFCFRLHNSGTVQGPRLDRLVHTIEIQNNTLKFDGETKVTASGNWVSNVPLIIGCSYANEDNTIDTQYFMGLCNIYSLNLDGHDILPCKKISTDEYMLYDVVAEEFLTKITV